MGLKSLVCPICGCRDMGKAKINGNIGICPACDETFVIEIAEQLSKVEVDKTKDIHIYRGRLNSAIDINDVVSILNYSKKLLDIIPDDYFSKYFFAYAQNALGNNRYIRSFYNDTPDDHTIDELDSIVKHIIEYSDLRDENAVIAYLCSIEDIDTESVIEQYKDSFQKRCRQEEYYDDVPRDVFICHRSLDSEKANKICCALEEDGNSCWISSRNLRPNDTQNYWDNITRAIESCKIFLVIVSRNAMLSRDVKREMDIAKHLNKPRLECKTDDYEHTTFFKVFFDGITWVDVKEINRETIACLKQRVYSMLYPIEYTPIEEFNVEGTKIIEYLGNRKHLVIPDGITEIDGFAFYENETIQRVEIPDSLLKIGDAAFEGCLNLRGIVFGNRVIEIGKEAFKGCSLLETLAIPKSIIYIRSEAFANCKRLEQITLDNSSIFIEENAFAGTAYYNNMANWNNGVLYISDALIDIDSETNGSCFIKKGTKSIARYAFLESSISQVCLPDTLEIIEEGAFADTLELEQIYIPKDVKYIGKSALSGCREIIVDEENNYYASIDGVLFDKTGKKLLCYPNYLLRRRYLIPHGTEEIANSAFESSQNLRWVKYPPTLKKIGSLAFSNCTYLIWFGLYNPKNEVVQELSIGNCAFMLCCKLREFEIRDDFSFIGRLAFERCEKIWLQTYKSEEEFQPLIKKWDKDWDSKNHYEGTKHHIWWGYISEFEKEFEDDLEDDDL